MMKVLAKRNKNKAMNYTVNG